MLSSVRSILFALLTAMALALVSSAARAEYTPPSLRGHGHIVDSARKLTEQELLELNRKIEGINQRTHADVAVYIPASLEGNTIEDVGYYTFKAWKLGDKERDDGVLVTIAPTERKIYITTGRGVGDKITDIQSRDITLRIGAHLKLNQFYAGIDEGTSLIAVALGDKLTAPPPPIPSPRHTNQHGPHISPATIAIIVLVVVILIIAMARSRRRNRYDDDDDGGGPPIIFFGGGGGFFGGGGGGGSDDSGGWGGGGDGGGGISDGGGGGDTGGGGAGSDY